MCLVKKFEEGLVLIGAGLILIDMDEGFELGNMCGNLV